MTDEFKDSCFLAFGLILKMIEDEYERIRREECSKCMCDLLKAAEPKLDDRKTLEN